MKQFNSKKIFPSVVVKIAVCLLLLGISYRLFSSSLVQFSPLQISDDEAAADEPPRQAAEPPELMDEFLVNMEHASQKESCDLFNGEWIPDSDGPSYTTTTCKTIEAPQNCKKNGRPDSDYIYWRWKPKDCSLPKLDAKRFLEKMRDKSLAFIGDSIMRNQVQSLLCMLSQVEEVVEVYHDEPFKNRRWSFASHRFTVSVVWSPFLTKAFTFENDDGVASGITRLYLDEPDTAWTDQYEDEPFKNRRWSFASHRFTVSVVWSPFLTKAFTFENDDGVASGITRLYLDEPDTAWTDQYEDFDYVVIGGGKWFLKPAIYYKNETIWGCHSCHDDNITEIGFEHAYRTALNSALKFISEANHRPYVLFRTTIPDHFENGEWDTGGYCNRTRPFKAGEVELGDIDVIMRYVEIEEFESAAEVVPREGGSFELFDATLLSLLRPDGHPGIYRQFKPIAGRDERGKIRNDCLHWCLPGPIDSWNELMMEMLLRYQR